MLPFVAAVAIPAQTKSGLWTEEVENATATKSSPWLAGGVQAGE